MKRRPSAGEQPDPGVGLEAGCVQKDPARQWYTGVASTECISSQVSVH